MAFKSPVDTVDYFAYKSPMNWRYTVQLWTKWGPLVIELLHTSRGKIIRFSMPQTFPGRKLKLSDLGKPQYDELKRLLLGDESKKCLAYCYFQFAERNMISETFQREDRHCAKFDGDAGDKLAECLHTGDYLPVLLIVFILPFFLLMHLFAFVGITFIGSVIDIAGKVVQWAEGGQVGASLV